MPNRDNPLAAVIAAAPRCRSPLSAPVAATARQSGPPLAKSPCAQAVPRPAGAAASLGQYRLEFDDGTAVVVRGRGLIGRAPAADSDVEHLIQLVDDGLSVSRTHLEFGVGDSGLWVRDCGSTNGSHIEVGGQRTPVGAALPTAKWSTRCGPCAATCR